MNKKLGILAGYKPVDLLVIRELKFLQKEIDEAQVRRNQIIWENLSGSIDENGEDVSLIALINTNQQRIKEIIESI